MTPKESPLQSHSWRARSSSNRMTNPRRIQPIAVAIGAAWIIVGPIISSRLNAGRMDGCAQIANDVWRQAPNVRRSFGAGFGLSDPRRSDPDRSPLREIGQLCPGPVPHPFQGHPRRDKGSDDGGRYLPTDREHPDGVPLPSPELDGPPRMAPGVFHSEQRRPRQSDEGLY